MNYHENTFRGKFNFEAVLESGRKCKQAVQIKKMKATT